MNFFNLLRQKPIILLDYGGNIANGGNISDEIACIGLTLCYGIVYSSQSVILTIQQGVFDNPITYRDTETFIISAGVARKLEVPIVGKFIKATITNSSGVLALVESLFQCRGFG